MIRDKIDYGDFKVILDCWILKCCVEVKGLEFCYECENFPCGRLSGWAKENTSYTQALERLRQRREELQKEG